MEEDIEFGKRHFVLAFFTMFFTFVGLFYCLLAIMSMTITGWVLVAAAGLAAARSTQLWNSYHE